MNKKALKHNAAKAARIAIAFTMAASVTSSALFTSASAATPKKYVSQYDSLEQVLEAGKELNLELASEGFVLLKNNDNTLPLKANERKVTVLGTAANALSTGGGGSGSLRQPGSKHGLSVANATADTLFDSLEAVGITANPRVRSRYESVPHIRPTGFFAGNPREGGKYMDLVETGVTGDSSFGGKNYRNTDSCSLFGLENNYSMYDDAALIVISRSGSENNDNKSNNVDGHTDPNEHALELDDAEKELFAYAKQYFKKIVVILNSPSVMELGCLEDDDAIGGILWIGQPGWNGVMAVGGILTGAINPSGRTVDFYMRDFTTDPTWYNFGNYTASNYAVNGEYETPGVVSTNETVVMGTDPDGEGKVNTNNEKAIDYAEGIYVGYRYYETVATELDKATPGKGEAWYLENTVYPFGYGLSYTEFTQEIKEVKGSLADLNGKIDVIVTVKNTGKIAGKEVVQLYSNPPYTAGGIDKASVNLVGFTKTDMLNPGESQDVTISIDVKDLASFDYNDANKNGFNGYELEKGDYELSIRKDSHTVLDVKTLTLSEDKNFGDEDGDASTPNNIYSQESGKWEQSNTLAHHWTVNGESHYLTRDKLLNGKKTGPDDLKKLAWLMVREENVFTDEAFNVLTARRTNTMKDTDNWLTTEVEDDYENLWLIKSVPENWTQGAGVADAEGYYGTVLNDMAGVDYDAPAWDTFMNQFTWQEMFDLISHGFFTTGANDHIAKDSVADDDGPGQFYDGWAWVCEVIIASTWNVDLAYEQGKLCGNESLFMNGADQGNPTGRTNGWYGPAANTHRSPLAGRNFEYYSQDGLQAGVIAAAVVKGATDMGCHVYLKHTFLNDQETARGGLATFATEQAMREIYAKPFELAIKKGNCNGLMFALNLIGLESSASYTTNVQLYTNEWGYKGSTVTDWWGAGETGWNGYQMIRGLSFPLGNNAEGQESVKGEWNASARNGKGTLVVDGKESLTQWYWARETAKRMLYVAANNNGNSNGYYGGYLKDSVKEVNAGNPVNIPLFGNKKNEVVNAFGSVNAMSIEISGLPTGLIYDKDSCAIVGETLVTGTHNVKISLKGTGGLSYITDSAVFTVKVNADPNPAGSKVYLDTKSATLGEAYNGVVTQNAIALTTDNSAIGQPAGPATDGKYVSLSYSATGLPQGLTLDRNTGAITGTPTQLGVFNVQITATLGKAYLSVMPWGSFWRTQNSSYSTVVAISVTGNGFNVIFDANYAGGTDTVKTVIGASSTVQNVFTGVQAPVRNDGYIFKGWATSADSKDLVDITSAENLTGETTYYAVWEAPEIYINDDGVWVINGVVTGIKANGVNGQDGKPGQNGKPGANGQDGVGVVSINKISSEDLVDTYEIVMSDGTSYTFTITNGAKGEQGEKGNDGAPGAKGETGDKGSGCSGSISPTVGIAAALTLIAAGVVVARKRKDNEN